MVQIEQVKQDDVACSISNSIREDVVSWYCDMD